jgi:hypothetical protein
MCQHEFSILSPRAAAAAAAATVLTLSYVSRPTSALQHTVHWAILSTATIRPPLSICVFLCRGNTRGKQLSSPRQPGSASRLVARSTRYSPSRYSSCSCRSGTRSTANPAPAKSSSNASSLRPATRDRHSSTCLTTGLAASVSIPTAKQLCHIWPLNCLHIETHHPQHVLHLLQRSSSALVAQGLSAYRRHCFACPLHSVCQGTNALIPTEPQILHCAPRSLDAR